MSACSYPFQVCDAWENWTVPTRATPVPAQAAPQGVRGGDPNGVMTARVQPEPAPAPARSAKAQGKRPAAWVGDGQMSADDPRMRAPPPPGRAPRMTRDAYDDGSGARGLYGRAFPEPARRARGKTNPAATDNGGSSGPEAEGPLAGGNKATRKNPEIDQQFELRTAGPNEMHPCLFEGCTATMKSDIKSVRAHVFTHFPGGRPQYIDCPWPNKKKVNGTCGRKKGTSDYSRHVSSVHLNDSWWYCKICGHRSAQQARKDIRTRHFLKTCTPVEETAYVIFVPSKSSPGSLFARLYYSSPDNENMPGPSEPQPGPSGHHTEP
ncbi:hypothetical protein A0H81_07042 [Grifola frondosa]|uniref:Uncharacterized protein n=1 Tax=Grifola frondosa TaxID=5627 RepID=A0A1C7M8I1_GRIFR|nr:hypothetical protein A0H81_07042 [Grifola frondosa]